MQSPYHRFRVFDQWMLLLYLIMAMVLTSNEAVSQEVSPWPDLAENKFPEGEGENDAALVISIEDYAFVEDVQGANKNAEDWYRYFVENKKISYVKWIKDQEATLENMNQQIDLAIEKVQPEGRLWIVYIGHGAPLEGKDGGLVGVDGQKTILSLQARSLSRNNVMSKISNKKIKTFVLLDACFSGILYSGVNIIENLQPVVPVQDLNYDGISLLTAAAGDQYAGPLPGLQRPAFSYLALGALKGWADNKKDGRITPSEINDYVEHVLSLTLKDRVQKPQVFSNQLEEPLSFALEKAPSLPLILEKLQKPAMVHEMKQEAPSDSNNKASKPQENHPKPISQQNLIPQEAQPPLDPYAGMVLIPTGKFIFGSEGGDEDEQPVSEVEMHKYYIDLYEVTVDSYRKCVEHGACTEPNTTYEYCGGSWAQRNNWLQNRGDHPVNCITWNQANDYCNWQGKHLPSEAEWERAARGSDGRTYPWGEANPTCDYAVIGGASWGCDRGTSWPVGSKARGVSPYGVHDMVGNVSEWVNDTYNNKNYSIFDEFMPPKDEMRKVARGSGFSDSLSTRLRVTDRQAFEVDYISAELGFRCAK